MNTHDLDKDELAEVFSDAALNYVASGDRDGYVLRLRRIGIANSEILDNLRELDTMRLEKFNRALALRHGRKRNAA